VRRVLRRLTPNRLRALGGVASLEVLVRGVGNASLVDLMELVGEELLVALAVGISSGWVGETVGNVLMWTVYAYALYTVIPGLFPESLSGLSVDRGLMGLLAVGAIVVAQPVTQAFAGTRQAAIATGSTGGAANAWLLEGFLLTGGWAVVVWLYLRFGRSEPIRERGTDTRELMELLDDDDEEPLFDLEREDRGLAGRINLALAAVLPALILAFLSFIFGCLAAAMSTFYPVPELLFVSAAILVPLGARVDAIRPGTGEAADVDLEAEIGSALSAVLRSPMGWGVAVTTILGVGFAVLVFFAGIFVAQLSVGPFVETVTDAVGGGGIAPPTFVTDFARVGAAVTLFCSALMLVWVWLRVARRSRAFTEAWENQWTDDPLPDPPTSRPPGAVVVPLALGITTSPVAFPADGESLLLVAYGLCWPLGLLAAGYWVRHTIRRDDPQPALADSWVYPGSCGLELLWVLAFTGIGPLSHDAETVAGWLFVYLLIVMLYYDPDLTKRLRRAGDPWESLAAGTVGLLAVPALGVGLLFPEYATIGFLSALVSLAGATISVAQQRRRATEDAASE